MTSEKNDKVYLTDGMVLFGLGLGAAYWIIECLLYAFMGYGTSFQSRLLGPDLDGLSTRIVVICLCLIFGAHAQFTINKRKRLERELQDAEAANAKLKKELDALKRS